MNRAERIEVAFPRLYVPQALPVRRWHWLVGPAVMVAVITLLAVYAVALFWK